MVAARAGGAMMLMLLVLETFDLVVRRRVMACWEAVAGALMEASRRPLGADRGRDLAVWSLVLVVVGGHPWCWGSGLRSEDAGRSRGWDASRCHVARLRLVGADAGAAVSAVVVRIELVGWVAMWSHWCI